MTIKSKSNILIGIFSILLVLNGIGLFFSLSKIKNANEHLIEETTLTFHLEELKFLTKNLQELGTDITLMGDKESVEKFDKLVKKYKNTRVTVEKLNTHDENKVHLEKIDSIFSNYIFSLKQMMTYGIQAVNNRNLLFEILASSNKNLSQEDKDIFNKFMNSTFNVEEKMDSVDNFSSTIKNNIEKVVSTQKMYLKKSIDEDIEVINTFKIVGIVLTIAFIASVLALFIIIKNILANVQKLDAGVGSLLSDVNSKTINIDTNDELGNISKNFNLYLKQMNDDLKQDMLAIENAKTVIGKVNAGLYNDKITINASSKEVSSLIAEINNMISTTQKNLNTLSDFLTELAKANYTSKMPELKVTGLLSSIFSGAIVTQTSINEVIAMIDNSTKRLSFSAKDLSQASEDLSNSSNKQAAALEETAAAIEEVTSTIKSGNDNTSKMLNYASNVTKSSNSGIELARKTSTSMDQLSNEVNTINEAITVIDQIAFQTNILSLNAAVEAATAGEAGKGFAVVAQEVRNLASRSAEAANEIKKLVESATSKANEGKTVASKMIDGFTELNKNITITIETINEVANATKEQEAAMVQINDTVNQLDQATQNNASLASQINGMAANTQSLASALQNAVDSTQYDISAKRRVCDTEFVFNINKLKTDHVIFKNVNFNQCEKGNKFRVKSHLECDFGKWILENNSSDFAKTQEWEDLKIAHAKVHGMVQDSVDLYADEYENGQIFSVTRNLEKEMKKVFSLMDNIKEIHCNNLFNKKD